MADVKFTGLSAVTPPIDKGSLVASSIYDGVSAYTSEKVTVSQLADAVFLMDAEQKITFDSSGTNKVVVLDSNSTCQIDFNAFAENDINITADNLGYNKGWAYISDTQGGIGWNQGGSEVAMQCLSSGLARITVGGVTKIGANSTGIGFFNATPVAKPSITGSRGGNAALADLLTDLASLGLITDSTTA